MSKHTKGEFKVKPCANAGKIVSFGEYSIQFANEHDAYFFAEAGTVANETNMTPRQLQERLESADILLEAQKSEIKRLNVVQQQNEDLKEALNDMVFQFKGIERYGSKEDARVFRKARKALSGQESRNKELERKLRNLVGMFTKPFGEINIKRQLEIIEEAKELINK